MMPASIVSRRVASRLPALPRRSFTLMEVLVAIALMVTLVGAMFGFFFDMLATRSRSLELAMQQRAASTLIEHVESDLAACIVGDAVTGAGVAGDSASVRILTRGVAMHLAERGAHDPDVFGDLQLAEYRFDQTAQRIEGRRASAGRADLELPPLQPFSAGIGRVRFRYHDGQEWRTSFDSLAAQRLPVAIEVSVWFNAWPEDAALGIEAPRDDRTNERSNGAPQSGGGNFDERSFAMLSDMDLIDPPPPDRTRVIALANADHGAASDAAPQERDDE